MAGKCQPEWHATPWFERVESTLDDPPFACGPKANLPAAHSTHTTYGADSLGRTRGGVGTVCECQMLAESA